MINRQPIGKNVYFTDCGSGWKRVNMTVYLLLPLKKDNLTSSALVPYLLERGTKNLPDNIAIRRKFLGMYGSSLSTSYTTRYPYRVVSVSVSGPDSAYTGDKSGDMLKAGLLLDVLLNPFTENGGFRNDWVDIEKPKLLDAINSIYNDKRDLCAEMLNQAAYTDERALPFDGFAEDLDLIDGVSLYKEYLDILSMATVEIFYTGADAVEVAALCTERFSAFDFRGEVPASGAPVCNERLNTKKTVMDVEQDKLAMLFSTGKAGSLKDYHALRQGSVILGGSAYSRLFNNIREKQSLCYYISSEQTLKPGIGIAVESGMSHENLLRVVDGVRNELRSLGDNGPTEDEMITVHEIFKNSFSSIRDSAGSLMNYYFNRLVRDGFIGEPEDELRDILATPTENITELIHQLKPRAMAVVEANDGEEEAIR